MANDKSNNNGSFINLFLMVSTLMFLHEGHKELEEMEADEKFLSSIEEQIGIKGSAKNNFRADITSYMFAKLRRSEVIDWKSYGPLKEAIESRLVASVRDISRIVTKSKSRDVKQQKKFNAMVQTLIDDYGYNEDSAEEVIKFASNNLWRDS